MRYGHVEKCQIYESEISPHVREFQIFHTTLRCGKIRNFTNFGGISKLYTCDMTDVKKSEFYPVFVCKICLWLFALFLRYLFFCNSRALAWKKLNKKLYCRKKNDKYDC